MVPTGAQARYFLPRLPAGMAELGVAGDGGHRHIVINVPAGVDGCGIEHDAAERLGDAGNTGCGLQYALGAEFRAAADAFEDTALAARLDHPARG